MPTLKSVYKTKEEIPEGYAGLYVEHGGVPVERGGRGGVSFHLTGIDELDALRNELSELKRQVAMDEYATRARINAAVDRATRDIRSPSFRRSMALAVEAVRRLFSHAPLGDDVFNPWSGAGWNITNQGKYLRQHGEMLAERAAKSVGSHIGATRPPPLAA